MGIVVVVAIAVAGFVFRKKIGELVKKLKDKFKPKSPE